MKTFVDFVNAITDYYSTKTLVMIKEYGLTSQSQSEAVKDNKDKPKNSIGFQVPVVEETDVDKENEQRTQQLNPGKNAVKKALEQKINELHKYPFDVKSAKRLARLQYALEKIEEKETDSN